MPPGLAHDVAQAQIDTTVSFLEQLSHGGEVGYDGEDRDWLLALTSHAQHTISAISAISASTDVTSGRLAAWSERIVRTGGAPFTHSGHWKPTGAEIMQVGQIARPHRRHFTPASRSGWR